MTEINAVLTAEHACEIVLGLFDGVMRDGKPERLSFSHVSLPPTVITGLFAVTVRITSSTA